MHQTVLISLSNMPRKVKSRQQRVVIRKTHNKKRSKKRKSKKVVQRGKGLFSILVPLLATAISTAVASS